MIPHRYFLPAAVFAALFFINMPAHASEGLLDRVQKEVDADHLNNIHRIAVNNIGEQGAIAQYLMEQANLLLEREPDRAARVFAIAAAYVSEVPDAETPRAVEIVRIFIQTASNLHFQRTYPHAGQTIFKAAHRMTGSGNVNKAAPDLQEEIEKAGQDFIAFE